MPRVLIAGFTALPGPHRVGVQLRHIMKALIRHHRVDVLVLRRGEQAYVERAGNARILRVPVPDGDILGRVEAFRRALRRQLEGADYDIVHFSDGWAGHTVLELQPQLKYATVYDAGRSPLTGPLPLDLNIIAELERAEAHCASAADLVLAPTEPARQFLAGTGNTNRVHLVAPGVDVDLFDWDLPPTGGKPLILYIGTLSQGRGIQVLLGAMLDLLRRCDVELVLAGRAGREFRQSLTATLTELGLDRNVRFAGVVDHARVPELIAKATVCVAPSAPEVKSNRLALYPTKILEYLACQRAVVAPQRSSISLLLRDGQTGLLFEPGQPSDLADKLHRAITDHALRARVARAGYDLVRRAHSASSTRRELSAAYAWLSSISPWRERFADASKTETAEASLRLPGPEDTEAGAWQRAPSVDHDRIGEHAAFDSDETMLGESTGSGSVETHISDQVGEVTRVELSPLVDPGPHTGAEKDDTHSTALYPIDSQNVDSWIVEDANTRPVTQSGVVGGPAPAPEPERARGAVFSSGSASFVSGELNVGREETAEVRLDENHFVAAAQMLGPRDEEEKTRLFEISDDMLEEKTQIADYRPHAPPVARTRVADGPTHPGVLQQRIRRVETRRNPPLPPPNRAVPPPTPIAAKPASPATGPTQPRAQRVVGRDDEGNPTTQPFPLIDSIPDSDRPGSDS